MRHTKRTTHGIASGEKVDEFSNGERDGHGDGGGDQDETYGEEEGFFLGFSEGDDLAEGRAGVGGRSEGCGEKTSEKRAGGRRTRREPACKGNSESASEGDGARRVGVRRTEDESGRPLQPDHSASTRQHTGQDICIPRDYFRRTMFNSRRSTVSSSRGASGCANRS